MIRRSFAAKLRADSLGIVIARNIDSLAMALALHAGVRNKLGRQSGLRATVERPGPPNGLIELQKQIIDNTVFLEYCG
jgi:hypothetical protein